MSKEMTLIILGLLIMATRTLLGLPSALQTALFIVAGGAVVIIGFLMRGETLRRGMRPHAHHPFVESGIESDASHHHDQKEGISSLN